MYNPDTELLFPLRVIPSLRHLRGEAWRDLVERTKEQEPDSIDKLAFVLMMIRLNGCTTCNADSFKAMRGCTACSQQTVRRFRGSDAELVEHYVAAREFIRQHTGVGR